MAEGQSAALHDGPYGRCVYRCDNDASDNQIVHMGFTNGMNASLMVSGFTRENTRTIHLMGSHREAGSNFARNEITVSDFRIDDKRTSQLILPGDNKHGGNDEGLVADFIGRVQDRLRHGAATAALTSLEESIDSHLIAFAADESHLCGVTVRLRSRPRLRQAAE